MAQTNSLNVEWYPVGEAGAENISHAFQGVNFISFVNDASFGIPAIISEQRYKEQGLPLKVLYVNPGNTGAMLVERVR